jgi:hypothetical protein
VFGSKKDNDIEFDIESLQYPESDLHHPKPKTLGVWNEVAGSFKIDSPADSEPPEMSLSQCLEMFGRLTDIGITIDWQTCRAMGMDDNPSVQLKLESSSIEGVLTELLAKQDLKLQIDPNGFPFAVPATKPQPQEEIWKLDEIVDPTKSKELAELLVSMWELEPFCREENGTIVWSQTANLVDKARAFETLKQLAKSLGKPSPKWSSSNRVLESPFSIDVWKASREILAKTVAPSVLQQESRSVTEILQTAAREVGAHILVDWKSAWKHGLTPSEEGISVLRNRTLPMIANRHLVQYALELMPISPDTFVLTTGKTRQSSLCVVPIRLSPEQKLENVKRALSTLRPIGPDGLPRLQMRLVPGQNDLYLARICPPNTIQIFKEEIIDAFGW